MNYSPTMISLRAIHVDPCFCGVYLRGMDRVWGLARIKRTPLRELAIFVFFVQIFIVAVDTSSRLTFPYSALAYCFFSTGNQLLNTNNLKIEVFI